LCFLTGTLDTINITVEAWSLSLLQQSWNKSPGVQTYGASFPSTRCFNLYLTVEHYDIDIAQGSVPSLAWSMVCNPLLEDSHSARKLGTDKPSRQRNILVVHSYRYTSVVEVLLTTLLAEDYQTYIRKETNLPRFSWCCQQIIRWRSYSETRDVIGTVFGLDFGSIILPATRRQTTSAKPSGRADATETNNQAPYITNVYRFICKGAWQWQCLNLLDLPLSTWGKWCIRAKIFFDNVNGSLRDPVVFRYSNTQNPHCRAGLKCKAYPAYQFA